jgi:hypothetical protein
MQNFSVPKIAVLVVFALSMLSNRAFAQYSAPFVGVMEWEFREETVKDLQDWLVPIRESLVHGDLCKDALMKAVAGYSRLNSHSESVLAKLLTGENNRTVSYARTRPDLAPTGLRVLPITLTDALIGDPLALLECLRELNHKGMHTLSISIGFEPQQSEQEMKAVAYFNQLFDVFVSELPGLNFVVAAGNQGLDLASFSGAPQAICEKPYSNLFCVMTHRALVPNWLEARIKKIDVRELDIKYGTDQHSSTGAHDDPFMVYSNYSSTKPLTSCGDCLSTSFAAPAFVRYVLSDNGARDMHEIVEALPPKWAYASRASSFVTLKPFSPPNQSDR